MAKLGLLLLCSFTIFFTNAQEECPPERQNLERSWEAKLEKDLSSRNVRFDRDNATEIHVRFELTHFELSESKQKFTMFSMVRFKWKDECLRWDPKKYGNVTVITISALEISSPGLIILNKPEQIDIDSNYFFTTCMVFYEGKVICGPKIRHDFVCDTQIRNWPFDMQDCSLKFSADTKKFGPKVKYIFPNRSAFNSGVQESMGWRIVNHTTGEELLTVTNTTTGLATVKQRGLYVNITIERVGRGLEAIVIYPSIFSMALTIMSLLPIIENSQRFGVICFSISCQFVVWNQISYCLPQTSFDTPSIVIFIRGSMAFSLIVFLVIYGLDSARVRKEAPPTWLSFLNASLLNTPLRYIMELNSSQSISILKNSDNEGEEKNIMLLNEWQIIANTCTTIVFTIICMVYLVLGLVFIPVERK